MATTSVSTTNNVNFVEQIVILLGTQQVLL